VTAVKLEGDNKIKMQASSIHFLIMGNNPLELREVMQPQSLLFRFLWFSDFFFCEDFSLL
jgi:hypothetical protein